MHMSEVFGGSSRLKHWENKESIKCQFVSESQMYQQVLCGISWLLISHLKVGITNVAMVSGGLFLSLSFRVPCCPANYSLVYSTYIDVWWHQKLRYSYVTLYRRTWVNGIPFHHTYNMNITNILDVDELIRFYNGELGIVLCVLYSVLFVRGKWLDNVETSRSSVWNPY